jgi:hypothetical protein
MSDQRLLKDAPPNRINTFTNTFSLNYPHLTSLSVSNQDAIMLAAAGAPAMFQVPPIPKPLASVLRMQSGQIPGSIPSSSQLSPAIAAELKGNVVEARDPFIDRLFPLNRAPFPIDKNVFAQLESNKLFDRRANSFAVPANFREPTLCQWLNDIGQAMAMAHGVPFMRRWWHGTGSLPPAGSDFTFKPDLVLLDESYYNTLSTSSKDAARVSWRRVRSFAEVTSEKVYPQRMTTTIDAKSYVMLTYQFNRRFVAALSISGASKYTLTLTDREGQIRFQGGALSDGNRENASLFLRILCFFMFGSLSDIGLDPHFISNPTTGELTAVMVDDRRFQLLQRIYTLDNMLGRGTKVWIVASNNEKFALKDSWVSTRNGTSEVDFLKAILGHHKLKNFVPTIVCGGDVKIDNERDWTGCYRTNVLGRVHGRRIHRRSVTTPVGEVITNFRSKKELVSVLMDVIRGALFELQVRRSLVAHYST